MLPESVKQLITGGPLAHVTTLDRSGAPHVTLAWIGLEGDDVVFGTLADQAKLRNIRRDPRVTISFHTATTNAFGLREYVVLHGRGKVVPGGAAGLLQRLARIYLGPDVVFPPMPKRPRLTGLSRGRFVTPKLGAALEGPLSGAQGVTPSHLFDGVTSAS